MRLDARFTPAGHTGLVHAQRPDDRHHQVEVEATPARFERVHGQIDRPARIRHAGLFTHDTPMSLCFCPDESLRRVYGFVRET
ncbi:hypothetical protein [Streptacidiphilus albus]|uniref:hypothetical protein n=1 Tax=Streptacidiphilus albus TaxID=105425 RepID=UPI00054BA4DF|nr:hypothetical protein [Streptacidiphilus albus]